MPWFVNWDDYKTNFEQEAGRILGHPVTVGGSANASILPSPSLTFTDVRVGPADRPPMMTVARFEVTIELMPLLQGEIRVTSMRLDAPRVRISVDAAGEIDWLKRPASAEALDPDKVVLSSVTISDGTIAYSDQRAGIGLSFAGITAAVEARSLAGPWRADGSYRDGDTAVPFHLATGRLLDDGTIRLKVDATPAQWPVDVGADGVVRHAPVEGLVYAGTYVVSELVENATGEAVPEGAEVSSGWRSEGAFSLTGDRLVIDRAILSHGPPDRPTSLAGALNLKFGDAPSFDVSAEARQLDLDRALGGGPNEPVEVAAATERMVAWLAGLPVPNIPGRVSFNVPAIVVGGSVIQDVAFAAAPAAAGWEIEGFRAQLPGQASIAANGVLSTDRAAGFVGRARLAVLQPATFASWWRGGSSQGAGRLLSAFDISGETEIAAGRISVDQIDAQIGDATITGRFAWSETARTGRRHLGTDLKADRIDFSQVKALAELLVGRDLNDLGVLADSFSVILATGAFQFDDIRMTDVAVNAEYSDDVLKIVRFSIGDLGGSSFKVTSGRIDQPGSSPRGELTAELEADGIDGLALIAGRFLPDSGLFEWLGRTADAITPAFVSARIVAPPEPGGTGLRVAIEDGVAGATTFDLEVELRAAELADWRDAPASLSLIVDTPDSAALARQIGLAAVPADNDGGAHIEIHGAGVPGAGLDTTVIADFAGVAANAGGALTFATGLLPTFAGDFGVSSLDLGPLIATAGLAIPGATGSAAVEVDGTLGVSDGKASFSWRDGRIAGRSVGGAVDLSRSGDRGWRIEGDLAIDEVNLGWLMSLGLGRSPLPTGDPDVPWSKEPFAAPGYGALSGKLAIQAERVAISDALSVSGARLALALQPQRIDLDLTQGHVAGGSAAGGMSIHNVDGDANLTAQFTLSGASLEALTWRLDQRAVATGIVDISANLEATGRSPSGLVTGMTGGGVVSVHDGEARYIDPTFAARQIIRASDLGQEFTEDAVRMTLSEQIGADTLRFGETGGAFTIAGGAVRLRGLSVSAPNKVEASGNAVLDLNTMHLDSDWTLAFDPGDTKVQGVGPKLGIVFRGPVQEPSRIVDALPFGSYLNTRREARILEIIAREEADLREREWFARVALKLRQEGERAERLAREAAERERIRIETQAAAAARLDRLHVVREARAEELAAASLRRWAEQTVAASDAAVAAAQAAVALADAERERAETLAAGLPALIAAEEDAAESAAAAESDLAARKEAASRAADAAAEAVAAAAEAEAAARLAAERAFADQQALEAAVREQVAADAALERADADLVSATAAVGEAEAEATMAEGALDETGRTLSEAVRARDQAAGALAAAEAGLAEAEAKARDSGAGREAAAQVATAAAGERDRLQATARMAAALAADAEAGRVQAAQALELAESSLAEGERAQAEAEQFALAAAGIAEALAADPAADAESVAPARATANAMELRKAARRAEADKFRQEAELARAALEAAVAHAATTRSQAAAAQDAFDAATDKASQTTAAAEQAVRDNAVLLNALSQWAERREAAAREAELRTAAAQKAGAAFDETQTWVNVATERLTSANAEREAADARRRRADQGSADAVAAVEARRGAAGAGAAESERAAAIAVEMHAHAAAAQRASAEAEALVGEAAAAFDTAAAAAEAARNARSAAQAEADAAAASADEAEAAAIAAADAAERIAPEAEAARRILSSEQIVNQTATVPVPRPRRQPVSLVPEAIGGDQPMVLVPGQ